MIALCITPQAESRSAKTKPRLGWLVQLGVNKCAV